MKPPLTLQNPEGGEIRLEWFQNPAGQTASRVSAFFYKSSTPGHNPLPSFPGCVDMRNKDVWPLAQGTIDYLDVGNVFISSDTGKDIALVKDTSGSKDFFDRPHALWYKKPPSFATSDGNMFLPPDSTYKITFTGSAEWPAQAINDVAFMPAAWTPIDPPSNAPATLLAGTDFNTTYNIATSTNLPTGDRVNTIVAFTANGLGNAPAVICQLEGTPGHLTVPAQYVDLLRAYGGGNMVRVNVSHNLVELNDGTTVVAPADRKRIDLVSFYCFIQPWVAG